MYGSYRNEFGVIQNQGALKLKLDNCKREGKIALEKKFRDDHDLRCTSLLEKLFNLEHDRRDLVIRGEIENERDRVISSSVEELTSMGINIESLDVNDLTNKLSLIDSDVTKFKSDMERFQVCHHVEN